MYHDAVQMYQLTRRTVAIIRLNGQEPGASQADRDVVLTCLAGAPWARSAPQPCAAGYLPLGMRSLSSGNASSASCAERRSHPWPRLAELAAVGGRPTYLSWAG